MRYVFRGSWSRGVAKVPSCRDSVFIPTTIQVTHTLTPHTPSSSRQANHQHHIRRRSQLPEAAPINSPPPCLVCYVPALLSESVCQSLLEPHHPHRAPLPQCPLASSLPVKSCSPAAKTGLLIKALQWSSLARDLIGSGSNATEVAPTRTAATSLRINENASGARVVCWDVDSRCWQM